MLLSTTKIAQLFLFRFCTDFSHKLGRNPSEKLNTGIVSLLGVHGSCNCCLLIWNQCSNGANKSYTWVSCRETLDEWCGRESCSIWREMCNFLFRFLWIPEHLPQWWELRAVVTSQDRVLCTHEWAPSQQISANLAALNITGSGAQQMLWCSDTF